MIAAIRRRLAQAGEGDKGLSLAEMLVAMAIFSLLLAMTVGFFVSASKASQLTRNLTTTNGQSSTAMNEVSRMLRGAITHPVSGQQVDDPAFSSVAANAVTFYTSSNLSGSTTNMLQVSYYLGGSTGTTLMEAIYQPTVSSGFYSFTTAPSIRAIAYNVLPQASGGPALFTYLDSTNTAIAAPATAPSSIAAVTVSIQIGASNSNSQSTLLTDTVGLPNVNIARNPS